MDEKNKNVIPAEAGMTSEGDFRVKLLSQVVNLIFPATCKKCDSPLLADATSAYFCKSCWNGIEWFDSPCCPRCGLPYTSPYTFPANKPYSKQSAAGHLCGNCRDKPPSFDTAISAGRYTGALSEAIKLFKYKKKVHLGKKLTEWALKSPLVEDTLLNFHNPEDLHTTQTLLIPVPLHVKRLREREFNQSAIIASVIGKRFGISVLANALIRHRHTMPQVELGGKDRKENVSGAFIVENEEIIEGKEIILVDDVYTSGSTVNECARTLRKNGAEKVYVVTIARMVE